MTQISHDENNLETPSGYENACLQNTRARGLGPQTLHGILFTTNMIIERVHSLLSLFNARLTFMKSGYEKFESFVFCTNLKL